MLSAWDTDLDVVWEMDVSLDHGTQCSRLSVTVTWQFVMVSDWPSRLQAFVGSNRRDLVPS